LPALQYHNMKFILLLLSIEDFKSLISKWLLPNFIWKKQLLTLIFTNYLHMVKMWLYCIVGGRFFVIYTLFPISLIHLFAKLFAKVLSLHFGSETFRPCQSRIPSNIHLRENPTWQLHPRLAICPPATPARSQSLFEVLHQYDFSNKFLDRLAVLLSSVSKFGTAVDYPKGPPVAAAFRPCSGHPL
jgi:hypothetical protein